MPNDLFCYGTLEIPAVLRAVTGRDYPSVAARLPDHYRALIRGEIYPGIVPRRGHETGGVLYTGLDRRALGRVDVYEGSLYRRQRLTVITANGDARAAWVYVLEPRWRHHLGTAAWDREAFAARHLKSFLAH